jgi:6-phosphogluconate dehydrogenase
MVHNGIEYAIMQMIAEAYETFRKVYHLSAPEIAKVFERYDTGVLDSFLIEITAKVLRKKDDQRDDYIIDSILDRA